MEMLFNASVWAAAVRVATPLLLAAFGCLLLAFQMEPYRFHNFLLFTLCFFAGEFSTGEAAP